MALQRANLIDPASPNPSVETLLHAFLPHKFVDHTHSTAILAIVDQEDSEPLVRKVFGARMGFVPYIMPGFDLAKAAGDVFDADPSVEGLILDKHGIFTFGDDAKQAYDRMIHYVNVAEDYVAKHGKPRSEKAALPAKLAKPHDIAPMLRGAVAVAQRRRPLRPHDQRFPHLAMRSSISSIRPRSPTMPGAACRRRTCRSASRPGRWRCRRRTPAGSATTRPSSASRSRPSPRIIAPISRPMTRSTTSSAPCSTRCRA